MALTRDQEEREHELRIQQMQTNIDNSRLNMKKLENDIRWETRKFVVQLAVGVAVCVGAGVALANYVNSRTPLAAPAPLPPQIIYIIPPAPAVSR